MLKPQTRSLSSRSQSAAPIRRHGLHKDGARVATFAASQPADGPTKADSAELQKVVLLCPWTACCAPELCRCWLCMHVHTLSSACWSHTSHAGRLHRWQGLARTRCHGFAASQKALSAAPIALAVSAWRGISPDHPGVGRSARCTKLHAPNIEHAMTDNSTHVTHQGAHADQGVAMLGPLVTVILPHLQVLPRHQQDFVHHCTAHRQYQPVPATFQSTCTARRSWQ